MSPTSHPALVPLPSPGIGWEQQQQSNTDSLALHRFCYSSVAPDGERKGSSLSAATMTSFDTNAPGGDDEEKTDGATWDPAQSSKFAVGAARLAFELQRHQYRGLAPPHQLPPAHMLPRYTLPESTTAGPTSLSPAQEGGPPFNQQSFPWKPCSASHPSIQVVHDALSACSSAAVAANPRSRKRRRACLPDTSESPPSYEEDDDPGNSLDFSPPVSTSGDYLQAEVSAVLQESFKRIRMESGDRSPVWPDELMEVDRPLDDAGGQQMAKALIDKSFSSLCPYPQLGLSTHPQPSSNASSPHALGRSQSPLAGVPSEPSQSEPAHHNRRMMISTRTNPDFEHYAETNLLLRTLHAAGRLSQQQQLHLPHASFDARESEHLTEQKHATTRYAPMNQLLRDLHLARYS